MAHEWTEFRQNLKEIYDGPSVPSHHLKQRLLDFVCESSKLCMNNEADILQYYWDFLALSKPLLDLQCVSIHKCEKAFWLRFHPCNHPELYARLIAKHPDQPSGVYFNYLDVYRVARVTFAGNYLLDFKLGGHLGWTLKPQGQLFKAHMQAMAWRKWAWPLKNKLQGIWAAMPTLIYALHSLGKSISASWIPTISTQS